MPTYQYKCKSCETEFEKHTTIAGRDGPLEEPCPTCQKSEVIRIPALGGMFQLNDHVPLSSDFKNLLSSIKDKNTTLSYKSTINDTGI